METQRTTISPIKTTGWAVGTRLFFVPIRYWEVQEPETGYVAEHDVCDEIVPDDASSRHVYAFHDGYGHTAYMERETAFETREEALLYASILIEYREVEHSIRMAATMARIHALIFGKQETTMSAVTKAVLDI